VYEIPLYLKHYKKDYGSLVYPGIFYVWLYNNLPRYAEMVETVSSQNIPPLVERYGVKKDKIFITGNGIDFDKYNYSAEKRNIITILGRLVSYKRVDKAIDIFREVRKRVGKIELTIIGDGPDKERIKQIVDKDADISMLGFLPEETKISLLQQSKIVISCSEFEGFGIVPIEAFACGAFPVVSDIPAHGEIVGDYGYLYKNVKDAASEICKMLKDEKSREERVLKGREFVESKYTWGGVCDRFLSSINKYIKSKKEEIL
jgi:glycosyltransferase involved in cell wall biosynthesis